MVNPTDFDYPLDVVVVFFFFLSLLTAYGDLDNYQIDCCCMCQTFMSPFDHFGCQGVM